MVSNPGDSNNFGPHCRNCHSGSSSCDQCHGPGTGGYTSTITTGVAGKSAFYPNSYLQTSAKADLVTGINGQCIDGGFSWPHRTLGANMLKDQLYGVDFDGTKLPFGGTRGLTAEDAALVAAGFSATPSGVATTNPLPVGSITPTNALSGQPVENLDSVCIDCHGNGTYYNRDASGTGGVNWELILKGLP